MSSDRQRSRESEQKRPEKRDLGALVEHVVQVVLADSALWPVLAVIALVLGTFGASLIVLVVQDRNLLALAALGLVGFLGVRGLMDASRRGRLAFFGGLALFVVVTSALGALAYLRLSS
jgi:hypothetical protein